MSILHSLFKSKKHCCELSALYTIKEQYELLTSSVSAGIVLFDNNNKVLYVSPYTEVLTGYPPDYFLSSDCDLFAQMVVDSDLDKYNRAKKIASVGEDMLVRYQIRHQRGFKLWLETRFVPVFSDEGKVKSIMALSLDLTESMNYQKLIEQQNQDLADFAYMISHDLKAPVFTIKGMALTLLQNNSLKQDSVDSLKFILQATDRLSALITSVVEYSSISIKDIEKDSVNLNTIINTVIADLQEQIRNCKAKILVDENMPNVTGSTVRIYQVFSNLIGNALKYRSPERSPEISVKINRQSVDLITIDITDNGLGIPAAKLGDVFRPFKRAHNNEVSGSGIGLASVKKILDKLEGSIAVRSTENSGSVFTVSLPLAENFEPNTKKTTESFNVN